MYRDTDFETGKKGEERGMVLEFNREYKDRFGLGTLLAEAYADDLTIMIKWDLTYVKEVIMIIKDFELVSEEDRQQQIGRVGVGGRGQTTADRK
jgi:hypothetical protein